MLWLIADVLPAADPSAWMPAISSVTSLGFAIWFSWYTTTKTIPDMQRDHRVEREVAVAVGGAALAGAGVIGRR